MSDASPRLLSAIVADFQKLVDELRARIIFLESLTIEPSEVTIGRNFSLSILGQKAGSALSSILPDGLSYNDETGTIDGVLYEVGQFPIGLEEALANARNSPLISALMLNVIEEPFNPGEGGRPYAWGDNQLKWGQPTITWGQALSTIEGDTPVKHLFWSDPFWTKEPFWSGRTFNNSFWSDPFWTRTPFWR